MDGWMERLDIKLVFRLRSCLDFPNNNNNNRPAVIMMCIEGGNVTINPKGVVVIL